MNDLLKAFVLWLSCVVPRCIAKRRSDSFWSGMLCDLRPMMSVPSVFIFCDWI